MYTMDIKNMLAICTIVQVSKCAYEINSGLVVISETLKYLFKSGFYRIEGVCIGFSFLFPKDNTIQLRANHDICVYAQ